MRLGDAGLKRTVLVFILRESSDVAKISAGVVPTTLPITIFFKRFLPFFGDYEKRYYLL